MEYLQQADFEKAKEIGLTYSVVYKRFYEYGWTREDAITIPTGHSKNRIMTDEQVRQLEKMGLSYFTIYSRIKKGMTFDEAIATKSRKEKFYSDEFIKKLEDKGIPYKTFLRRIKTGWSEEIAANTPPLTKGQAGSFDITKVQRRG